jgi:hypothetical protein
MPSTQDRLVKLLKATPRGFSRDNPELVRIAKLAKLSVHTVQSAAMQRRDLTAFTEPRIAAAIVGKRYVKS